MASFHQSLDGTSLIGGDQRAEIVDRLYDVALDPMRLEELLDTWEMHMGPLRQDPLEHAAPLCDPEIDQHLRRAALFLDRLEATRDDAVYRSVLDDIPRSAAFISDGGQSVTAINRPAAIAFGLTEGAELTRLPFEPDDIRVLNNAIQRAVSGRATQAVTLRVRSTITGSPVILRVGPVESFEARPLALVMSTEQIWPEGFEMTVQEAFGLTAAEVEIVRGISQGMPLKAIAETRGRSVETVRTQLRSILAKSETHSQSELVRVVLGLMDVATMPTEGIAPSIPLGTIDPVSFNHMKGADGRRLEWIEFGSPTGAPCLYLHLHFGLIRWPAAAERAARLRGLRVIVPVRAGYGQTNPLPRGANHLDGVVTDYLTVLDRLGVRQAAIVSLGADLRFAAALAARRPAMFTGILGCSASLPLKRAFQYERMGKWQRFAQANARYAPNILPFVVQAGFSLARRIGKDVFFARLNATSRADMESLSKLEIREALLAGTEVLIGARNSAHQAFADECLTAETDWSGLVRTCPVPIILLQGDQDLQAPAATIRELLEDYPDVTARFVSGSGQLLFFSNWAMALDVLERFLPRR
jgi:pimeloyl-ACP methyl ester carboxylesterase/DNA-binding CsgD family transcriptional regulator